MKNQTNETKTRVKLPSGTGKGGSITFRILVPLTLAIVILLVAFVFAFRWDQEKRSAQSTERASQEVEKLLRIEQEEEAALLTTTIKAIMNDGELAAAFRARDRAALIKRAGPLFQTLKKWHGITHFYFELPDRTVLLRLHDPSLRGDKVNRLTMLAAARTGEISSGVEHGLTGSFTLRTVAPWLENGQLIGYVELGVEFENIVQTVHGLLDENADFVVAIDKKFLDRKVWNTARTSRHERDSWDQFPSCVIIDKTVGVLPQAVLNHLANSQSAMDSPNRVVVSEGRDLQLVFLPLAEVSGEKVGQVIVLQDVTATVERARRSIRNIVLLCLIVGGGLIGLFYLLLTRIERTLAERTANLEKEIQERGRAEQELREMQGRLVDTSRRAGMAEVATSVLHNVGNVLNSVNVASSCVADSLKKSKAQNLSKVVDLLREHETDLGNFLMNDPKGKQLPGYLGQLARYLAEEQIVVQKELAGLQKNIEHIKDIVTMQQGYAKVSGVAEPVQIADVVEDALRMNASGLLRHDVEVIREFGALPPIVLERSKVMQILVNLISNAKYACDSADQKEKRIVVHGANGSGSVRITVSDNGVGISEENLARIFAHGFTTRKEGHGFGLHSAVLAAQEMGGTLTAASEGPNRGATFTLELPLQANGNGK